MARNQLIVNGKMENLPNGFSPAQIASAISNDTQELIILPTERCNLRCTYCYEDFAIGKMSEETQRAIELFVERRIPKIKALRFAWFGGEPLLAKEVVLRLSRFAARLCRDHGVQFLGGLTTNAWFLEPDLFQELLQCQQDFFQITLDGWGETHDAVRKFADGRGTFEKIWANLLEMKAVDREFEILLRIHVRRDNIEALPELMKQIAVNFGNDRRFRLDFEHVRNLGGAGGASVKAPVTIAELKTIEAGLRETYLRHIPGPTPESAKWVSSQQKARAVEAALETAKSAGESAGSQRASDLAVGGPYICYASRPNSLLIRADGRIGKCTVAFNDDRNTIGKLNSDGTITVDNAKLRPWLRGLENLDAAALGCPIAGMPVAAADVAAE